MQKPAMITIVFQTTLRHKLGIQEVQIAWVGGDVYDALRACSQQIEVDVCALLLTPKGELIQGVMLLLNGKNVLVQEGLATDVQPGDSLYIFPPAGGG